MYLTKIRKYCRKHTWTIACCLGILSCFPAVHSFAQPQLSIELKKPKIYESRTLPSERSGDTKFNAPKRFYNNLVSRFNYYFNANTQLNDALANAKATHTDDYTQLLSFYNYTLDETRKGKIDSVLYKATAGIVLHDLRSDWVDKLYLLMGKAYLYRKDFDSATYVFQYINYAFAPKDNGYDIPIGSNASNTNGVFTIATRENRSLWKKIASFPPSRNESFIWQARTYIEQDELAEASGLLELIRTDPNFPERLRADLHELTAYLMYKQQQWEGSADHLLQALDNAETKLEKARWEYLAAQMYQLGNRNDKATLLFERAIQHTSDPLMEVNARMNIVSLAASAEGDAIQKTLDELLKMAKRDKYEGQRDIIYYAAAQLEIKRKNYAAAQALLLNSIKYSTNPLQKQLSFLLLGDMNYPIKQYSLSHKYYDSVQTAVLKDVDRKRVDERKPALKIISENITNISAQDSLQKIAALTPDERDALVKKVLRQLRKEKGLKDADAANPSFGNPLTAATQTDLFSSSSGEFYFLNASLKAKGSSDFKSKWGNRPNVDNWRRQSAVVNSFNTVNSSTQDLPPGAIRKTAEPELTFESLSKNIPLTGAQLDSSNKIIIRALLSNAATFQNQLEDYPSAVEAYEELIRRFPESAEVEQALYNLAYVYKKTGEPAKADAAAAQLQRVYGKGKLATQMNAAANAAKNADPAEKQYANIYNMFLSGKFEEAKEAKLKADKEFGKNYWTPQLLYIESIYYIKQKQDSVAINRLQNIVSMFGKSPLAEKATTMIDVLKRRPQIEAYLANLNLNKQDDITSRGVDLNATTTAAAAAAIKKDSVVAPKTLTGSAMQLTDLSNTKTMSTAIDFKKDSTGIVVPKDIRKIDITNAVVPEPAVKSKVYTFNTADTQYVVVVLNNVDPIFITEGRNAFNRYNQEIFSDKKVETFNRKINAQYNFLMVGPFANATEAMNYIDRTRPLAKTRIVPWLTADKYSFSMISNANMELLLSKEDVDGYHTFIRQIFPDKF